jgi:hypothetical protein
MEASRVTDEEFFQHLYDLFSYTSGVEDHYWDYRGDDDEGWDVHAVNQDGDSQFVGFFDKEADADFITAIHGALPDLIRRLEDAIYKAEMYELAHDQCQRELFESEKEVGKLKEQLK